MLSRALTSAPLGGDRKAAALLLQESSMSARVPARPQWQVRTPTGTMLTVEYDPFRSRWRVTPGGYESRSLPRVLARATGASEDADWVQAADAAVRRES